MLTVDEVRRELRGTGNANEAANKSVLDGLEGEKSLCLLPVTPLDAPNSPAHLLHHFCHLKFEFWPDGQRRARASKWSRKNRKRRLLNCRHRG
jgi:hypothetical protein